MRLRIPHLLLALITAAALFVIVGLTLAHIQVVRDREALPGVLAVALMQPSGDLPTSLSYVNTASQRMPRSAVLDPNRDPNPKAEYVMSHVSFVLRWQDGRILLIDTGMTPDRARNFGRPIEWFAGGEPMEPHRSAASALGESRERVEAIVFTHLHSDHVGGTAELCAGRSRPIRVFMTKAQAEHLNYTTRPGFREVSSAPCVKIEKLAGGPLYPVPGFDGVHVINAGGHTPGSQIILAAVDTGTRTKRYLFTGDIVNHVDAITHDVDKPYLYRLLVVPESDDRQKELRRYIRSLRDDGGFTVLVSHDRYAIEATDVNPWPP